MRTGAYVILFELDRERRPLVGRLGRHRLAPGRYAYVGSALSGLDARIARHLRHRKKRHWHIDYVLPVARVTEVVEIEAARRLECLISQAIAALAGTSEPIRGFGSSDCRCRSHLHALGDDGADAAALRGAIASAAREPGSPNRVGPRRTSHR